MSQDLRARLKAARKKLEITQIEAARAWGVPLGTLICWENNKRNPTPFTRGMLDTMLDEILEEHGVSTLPAPRGEEEEPDLPPVKSMREIRPDSPGGRRMMGNDDDSGSGHGSDFGLPG